MRIVIDMQGAQTDSRFRGIGRYTLSLVKAMVRLKGDHDVLLALNGHFPETIEPIRIAFEGLLYPSQIRVWSSPSRVPGACEIEEDWHRKVAERMREDFLASLRPDMVLITSLFEGFMDAGVITIREHRPEIATGVIFYDLIPLLNPEAYLNPNPLFERVYRSKIAYLEKSQVWLGISESASSEGREILNLPQESVFNISTACDDIFRPKKITATQKKKFLSRFGIVKPFLLYAGGSDNRKNLPRLIRAFAGLPQDLLTSTQLVLAGKMPEENVENLKRVAEEVGVTDDQLIFTGYITDEDLHGFYCLTEAFVFPSTHEGFGLPPLEAMSCGTVVVASNTTSIPEVVGLDEAMFDPLDQGAITESMVRALKDESFRTRVRKNAAERAKLFSWDISAEKALRALELKWSQLSAEWTGRVQDDFFEAPLQSLVGSVPNDQVGAWPELSVALSENLHAGEIRQLLVDVSELSQGDGASGVQRVVRSYLRQLLENPPVGFRVEPVYASVQEGYRYARSFTDRFLGQKMARGSDYPIEYMRGDIFFGLDLQHHVQLARQAFFHEIRANGVTVKFLVHDLLPIQLPGMFRDAELTRLHGEWLRMIASMDGAICVSAATRDAYQAWMNEENIPRTGQFRLEVVHNGADLEGSVPSRGLPVEAAEILNALKARMTFLSVATLEPRKGQSQLIDAFEILWEKGLDLALVLVGHEGWDVSSLVNRVHGHREYGSRLLWLKSISDEYLDRVYEASTCLVAASLNEGFGLPLIEAAKHQKPVLARDIPVFREIAGNSAYYFKGNRGVDVANSIETWLGLFKSKKHPKTTKLQWATWAESAQALTTALVEQNYPRRQLLVDISALAVFDAKTGIQRVVRNVLREWLLNPPEGYRVEPVFATDDRGYRYARTFTHSFMQWEGCAPIRDDRIEFAPGDLFFVLDMQPDVQPFYGEFYQTLRARGVTVKFLVHDLLCLELPQYFAEAVVGTFTQWMSLVAASDGALCVSKATATSLAEWIASQHLGIQRRPFEIEWSHNGADILEPGSENLTDLNDSLIQAMGERSSFLMVGTLEPRKGHAQVLDAFEQLWAKGQDINLVLVGKLGWLMETFSDRLRLHPEYGQRLFWFDGISDDGLCQLYQLSTCLIAASYGEGFGLPLIEASRFGTPVLARDLPVFREIAGNHVSYFQAQYEGELAHAIEEWLIKHKKGRIVSSSGIPSLNWSEAAQGFLSKLLPLDRLH